MRNLAVAVTTLTRIPVPGRLVAGGDAARATVWFPVVGALIGLVVGGVLVGAGALLGVDGQEGVATLPAAAAHAAGVAGPASSSAVLWVAAVLAVLTEVVLTGVLHLDGLADTADGLAGRDREHRLAIMKDHANGVYGVTAIVLDLLLKAACLAALLDVGLASSPWVASSTGAASITGAAGWVVVLVLVCACYTVSRTAMLPLARALPYARAEGTGRAVIEGITTGRVIASVAVAAVLLGAGVPVAAAGLAASGSAVVNVPLTVTGLVAVATVVTVAVGLGARRLLGGVTGDILGATAELTLLAGLVVVLLF